MAEEIDRQLDRLVVRHGDILVLRTRQKLQPATAAKWQDELIGLCKDAGVRDVTVLVLDDCTDLSIERPQRADTRMQHQAFRPTPIVSR
ncbi:hypothetical protein [Methylobacterium sp. E-066]|uniref:hypothetical protein n=1 Tax=Methylobacterium sp. E-066 TaxID=2836584 RepID=UPI001FB98DA9|nr:hypothetical protein [Methylobacterium sp. E-066]MCJ2143722.1 hypothetical protein [Methylobacterium sp. E-066]